MDCATAQSVLQQVLGHLPFECWWLLHQKGKDDLGLATAFGRPRAEIEALLVNARVCKMTSKGLTILKLGWENYTATLSDPICVGSKGHTIYITNIVPRDYATPAK